MSQTEINFFAGFDPVCFVPKALASAGMSHRLAVVQETYRPDSVDMYFDLQLWRRLLAFAEAFHPDGKISIVDRPAGKGRHEDPRPADEMTLSAYAATEEGSDDPDPAEYIMVRNGDALVLCIATEFWTQVGGPTPYADSYTYSIFSTQDLSERVMRFLAEADAASGWRMASVVREAPRHKRKL